MSELLDKTRLQLEKKYDVVVIDPPWEVIKYPTKAKGSMGCPFESLSFPQIVELVKGVDPFKKDCHVFLWTTQGFLPSALLASASWGMKQVCVFTWVKNIGPQPMGYPKYNSEFVVYLKKGRPEFSSTRNFSTAFYAKAGVISEKPEEFYEMIRKTTAGDRLDMFNRREIEGFDTWGLEAK